MPRPVSHLRLEAEAHAFPLSAEPAFKLRLTALTREAAGVLDSASTKKLADALEADMRPRAGGMSLEVLRQLRDSAWFPAQPDVRPRLRIPLDEHLAHLASLYLEYAGHRVRLRSDGDPDGSAPCERALRWRWLSFYLPADLLVAALAAREGFEPPDDAVLVVPPRLAEVIREPCAETHLHVGAGVPFGLLWAARMREIAVDRPLDLKPWVGTPPFGDARAFQSMLLAAATGRLVLAAYLWRRQETGDRAPFDDFLKHEIDPGNDADTIAARVPWGLGAHEARRALYGALWHLWGRGAAPPLERVRRFYQALIGRAPPRKDPEKPRSIEDVVASDPLSGWLPWREGLALPEARFACRALRYLAGEGRRDEAFAGFFWQYQRVRCLSHRFLVEEPGTAGLDWFTRHYARVSPLRGTLSSLTYASALQLQSRDLSLGALEARTAPEPHWPLVRDEVRALAEQAALYVPRPMRDRPQVGLVLHFIKEWERSLPRGRKRLHADPRQAAFGCRFGSWHYEQLRRAMAIETALRHDPELLLVLRGLDVANVELGVPTWPLVPLFRRVREASRKASARLARLRPAWEAAPLRVTVHAGEDFRRLVEGLRRIHEPIEHRLVQVGDRIGHGVALGEDPERWADAARLVTQPAEERLDDLLWEMARYQRAEIPADTGRVEYVRAEALRIGREIYRAPVDVEMLIEARRLRHQPEELARVGYPFIREPSIEGARKLFYRYLTDPDVFDRGQRAEPIEAGDHEVRMLKAAQRWLRGVLGRMEITVESNPSSNLVIADYIALEDHAAFRMQPLAHMREPEGGSVLVSVNTDNPITFASSLADEFAHLYFALLGRDVPADEALAWLARARENGFRSRFTLRASAVVEALREVAPERRKAGAQRQRSGVARGSSTSS